MSSTQRKSSSESRPTSVRAETESRGAEHSAGERVPAIAGGELVRVVRCQAGNRKHVDMEGPVTCWPGGDDRGPWIVTESAARACVASAVERVEQPA